MPLHSPHAEPRCLAAHAAQLWRHLGAVCAAATAAGLEGNRRHWADRGCQAGAGLHAHCWPAQGWGCCVHPMAVRMGAANSHGSLWLWLGCCAAPAGQVAPLHACAKQPPHCHSPRRRALQQAGQAGDVPTSAQFQASAALATALGQSAPAVAAPPSPSALPAPLPAPEARSPAGSPSLFGPARAPVPEPPALRLPPPAGPVTLVSSNLAGQAVPWSPGPSGLSC